MYQLDPVSIVSEATAIFPQGADLTIEVEGRVPANQNALNPKKVEIHISITDGTHTTKSHYAGDEWRTAETGASDDLLDVNEGIYTTRESLKAAGFKVQSIKTGFNVNVAGL